MSERDPMTLPFEQAYTIVTGDKIVWATRQNGKTTGLSVAMLLGVHVRDEEPDEIGARQGEKP